LLLSVNVRLPEAATAVVGVKVIATVQVPDAATGVEVEQVVPVVATANGAAVVIPVKVRLALPVLVTVTVCAALVVFTNCALKLREAPERLTIGAGGIAVPVRLTVCVVPAVPPELSVTVMVAVRVPLVTVGSKVTLIVQVPPAATGALALQVVALAIA